MCPYLVVSVGDSDALLELSVGPRVVDDDGELPVDEVTCQQVAALARELVEVAIERHEVLRARKCGVA